MKTGFWKVLVFLLFSCMVIFAIPTLAQMIDKNKAPNAAQEGINKTFLQEIGAGRGDPNTPDSSSFIIARDPFRSIRRGRQLFQRKFTRVEGQGPVAGDGFGDVNTQLAIGAGLADSCAACHGRPRGSAGAGGDVCTRPDSRDAPHLFGLGLKEMLADEITSDLRAIRTRAISDAQLKGIPVTKQLKSKGIRYGSITANPDGALDTSKVQGVNADLRVRPFFSHGKTISIREFIIGALNDEMGLQAVDPDLLSAHGGGSVTTPSGMVLNGQLDQIDGPKAASASDDPDGDGVTNEIPTSVVDHLEFYLLNYFKAGTYEETKLTQRGRLLFVEIGCANCHIPDLRINHDRRVANVETVYDPVHGFFNQLFSTASVLVDSVDDGSGYPPLRPPNGQPFLVKDIFTDFKRHDLGPNFHERNFDGTMQTQFITTALWGVGSTAPYGHDGRSINLTEVILRHGQEAQSARDHFADLSRTNQHAILDFLNSLVLFPPDDTASNLNPGDSTTPGFPQFGHGSIKLQVLFNDPGDAE